MGFILSKFRRSKPSTKDVLEKIDQDLRKLSRFQYDTELQQKRIIGRLVVGGVFLYLIFLVLAYFFGPRDLSWQQTLGWVVPFVLFPFLLITVKRGLGWYFNRKIVKNKDKYESLKKEKQRLLDEVMETETFKVAKEILEKYAPNHLLPKYLADQQKASPMSLTPVPRTAQLRRRSNAPLSSTPTPVPYSGAGGMGGFTPRAIRPYGAPPGPGQFLRQPTNTFYRPALMPGPSSSPATPGPSQGAFPRGPPPPRLMLPPPPVNPQYRTRKTGWIDKLVDYVVGDGPTNRFALICRYCATHNGLATPEDFPYIGYKCVYCRQFNPPRQVRPSAATLPKNTVLIEEMDTTSKSTDTTVVESDADNDENPKEKANVTENQEGNADEPNKDSEDAEDREKIEPLVELAASSCEDLTRSVESLLQAEGAATDGEQNEIEQDEESILNDDDSQKEGLNVTLQEDDSLGGNEPVSLDEGKESQEVRAEN